MKATASTLVAGMSNILQWSLIDRTCSKRRYSTGPFKGGRDGSVMIIDHHSVFISGTILSVILVAVTGGIFIL